MRGAILYRAVATFVIAGGFAASVVHAAGLQLAPATLAAFDRYVQASEARMKAEQAGSAPFLWIDRLPERDRDARLTRLRAGEVVSAPLVTRDRGATIDVPDATVQHWIGTVFFPGVTLDRVEAFVRDYPRYPERFAPMVSRAKVLSQTADRYDVAMRTVTKKVLTVVLDADYHITYTRLSPTRLVTRSYATNLFHVHDAGTPKERREPVDGMDAFLWRIHMYCSFDTRPEGTYEQCESISLSRSVPVLARVFIGSMIDGVARETLAATLGRVRTGLLKNSELRTRN